MASASPASSGVRDDPARPVQLAESPPVPAQQASVPQLAASPKWRGPGFVVTLLVVLLLAVVVIAAALWRLHPSR
jgi:hypothetical protein